MKTKKIQNILLIFILLFNDIYTDNILIKKKNIFLKKKNLNKYEVLNELQGNKNLEFNKHLFILTTKILKDIEVSEDKKQIFKIIKKNLNLNSTKYSPYITAYFYPNLDRNLYFKSKLIKNIKDIQSFETIKDIIKFNPQNINLEKQICIPSLVILKMKNISERDIIILGTKTDLYQTLIVVKKKNLNESEYYINQKTEFPKILPSGETILFQIVILIDSIEVIKGNIYIELNIDNKKSVIIYPISVKGIENKYKIKPIYFHKWNKGTFFSSDISIYNPHSDKLIIYEIINSFTSITLSFNNEIKKDIEVPTKKYKKILTINLFKEYSENEYGLLHFRTNKDTIVIPVLIKFDDIPFNIFPSFFNFGIIKNFNKEIRVIPINISNNDKQKLLFKGIFLNNEEKNIGFMKKDELIYFDFNQTKTVGYLYLNCSNINYDENKKFKGIFFLETNNKINPIIELKYKFSFEKNENKDFILNNSLYIDNFDNSMYLHKMRFPNQIPLELIGSNTNYEIMNITNFLSINAWSKENNLVVFRIKIGKKFSALNAKNYYIPLKNILNSFYILPFTIYDESVDFYICKRNNGNLEMCNKYFLYSIINCINDPLSYESINLRYLPIGNIIKRNIIFKNKNNKNISFEIKTNKIFVEKNFQKINKINIPPFSESYMNLTINSSLMNEGNYSENISLIFDKNIKNIEIKMTFVKGKIEFIPSNLYFYSDIINYHNALLIPILIKHSYPLNLKIISINSNYPYIIIYQNFTNNATLPPNIYNSNLVARLKINPYKILYSKIIDREKYMISYFQLFQWKQLKQFFNNVISSDKNITIYSNLESSNINFIIKNDFNPNFIYTKIINFKIVQIGNSSEKYIKIFNPTNKILTIKPFIADSRYFEENFNFSEYNISNFNDLKKEYYNFSCYFQDKTFLKFNSEILFSTDEINFEELNNNFINKIYFKLKSTYEKKKFQEIKNIICSYNIITKDEIFLKNIHAKSKNALLSYNIDVELNNIFKEVYLDKNASKLVKIDPAKEIIIGPIIYSPLTNSEINSILILRNNHTFITLIKLIGKGGEGIPKFFIDNQAIINNSFILKINEPLIEVNKIIKIKNIGDLELKIRKIKFNNIDYSEKIKNSIYMNKSKEIKINIPVLYNFKEFLYILIVEYGICQNKSINIIVQIDKKILYSKNFFFEFNLTKIFILVLILFSIILNIILSLKEKKIIEIKYLKEDELIKIENKFLKSYIRKDDKFYEEFEKEIAQLIFNHSKNDGNKKKKKREKGDNNFLYYNQKPKNTENIKRNNNEEVKLIKSKSNIIKENINIINSQNIIENQNILSKNNLETKILIPKILREHKNEEEKKTDLSSNIKELIEQFNSFGCLENAFIPQSEKETNLNKKVDNLLIETEEEFNIKNKNEINDEIKINDNKSENYINNKEIFYDLKEEKKIVKEQIKEYDFKSFNSNEIFTKPIDYEIENDKINFFNNDIFSNNNNNNLFLDIESSGNEEMNLNIKNILKDSLLNYNFGNINIIDENNEEEFNEEDEKNLIKPHFDFSMNPFIEKDNNTNLNNFYDEEEKEKNTKDDLELEKNEYDEEIKNEIYEEYDENEPDPEWNDDNFDMNQQGYFDENGTFKLKERKLSSPLNK